MKETDQMKKALEELEIASGTGGKPSISLGEKAMYQLFAGVERIESNLEEALRRGDLLASRNRTLAERLSRVIDVLKAYGGHTENCPCYWGFAKPERLLGDAIKAKCDCGFDIELETINGWTIRNCNRQSTKEKMMGGMMKSEHWTDQDGNPAGGTTYGRGFTIGWQNGPLGSGKDRREPNGAFVEDIIRAAIHRIEFYQGSRFVCRSNANALEHLTSALDHLNARTRDREDRGVEGTHTE